MSETMTLAQEALDRPEIRALVLLLGSMLVAVIVDRLFCRGLVRLTVRTNTDLDDRLIGLLHRPVFISVVLVGAFLAVRTLGVSPFTYRVAVGLIHTTAVVVWTVSGVRIISTLLEGLSTLADRVRWLDSRTLPLFDNVAKLLLFGGAVYCLLLAWDLNVAPWLASAGIIGIALGFAAKDTLANLFGGLFIIVDAPYRIGDFVNLDSGERGRVTRIGLRSTRLLTRDDVEITLPNAVIANAKIINESGGPWEKSRVTIKVGVAYGSDVDRVREALLRAARSVDHVVPDPEPRIRFLEMGDSALIFRVMCWVDEPVLRGRCVDGLNTAVYKTLAEEEIQIPFPQREIHLRQPLPAGPA
jgi:small-conductance mechanosensitive channel